MKINSIAGERTWLIGISIISVVVVSIVALLLWLAQTAGETNPAIYTLPKLNALINTTVAVLLTTGFYFIRKKNIEAHRTCMYASFILSVLFLVSYITYHYNAPHTSFGGEGAVRYIYFFILLTHILLATAIVPLALVTLFRILNLQPQKHKKIARITLPIWIYVSITGVVVYLMISPYYPV